MASCNTTVFKRKTVTKSSTNEKMHCLLDSCRKKNLFVGDGGGATWLQGPPLGADGEARAAPPGLHRNPNIRISPWANSDGCQQHRLATHPLAHVSSYPPH